MIQHKFPVGRIVWGSPLRLQQKKDNKGTPLFKKDGSPRMVRSFGLAVPKDQCASVFEAMQKAAAEVYPQGVPGRFAWKFKDGDTAVDNDGTPYRDLPGRAGCNIFTVSTETTNPNCYVFDHAQNKYVPTTDGIKCGDFVEVVVGLQGNKPDDPTHTPGLYLNPNVVALNHIGEEIRSSKAPDPNKFFAPPPVQTAPMGASLPSAPLQPGPAAPPQSTQASPFPPAQAPAPTPTPHTQFLNGPRPDPN